MPDLMVNIKGDTSGLDAATGKATSAIESFGSGFSIPTSPIAIATTAIAGLASITIDAGKAGIDARAAQEAFQKSLAATGADMTNWEEKTNAAVEAAQGMAFTDDDARAALETLTRQTGSVDAATTAMAATMDIARASGTDLATAADAVAEAMDGSDTKLTRMIDGLAKAENSQLTLASAVVATSGQAEAFGNSTEAMGAKISIGLSELMEFIGTQLLPIIDELGTSLQPWIDALFKIVNIIWPLLRPVLSALIETLVLVVKFFGQVGTSVSDMIDWLGKALQPIQDIIDKIASIDLNPLHALEGFDFNPFNTVLHGASALPEASSRSGGMTGPAFANITFNISGDPSVIEAKVTTALRNYARRNGGAASVFQPGRR